MFQIKLFRSGGVPTTFVFEDEALDSPLYRLAQERSSFKAKAGELFYLPKLDGPGELLAGLGKEDDVTLESLRELGFNIAKKIAAVKEEAVELSLPELDMWTEQQAFLALAEGVLQANYRFSRKSKEEEEEPKVLVYFPDFVTSSEAIHRNFRRLKQTVEAVFVARDLVNSSSNEMTPRLLAERAEALLIPQDVEVQIYDEKAISELGMEAFLSVAKGSDEPPRLIVMNYTGRPEEESRTALVGKGVTYDSGGYCLKPAGSMATMHSDMAGAASVIGTILALAKNRIACNVVGVVAACENLISGSAYKTGDIIGSMSGKTIEVANTDAEGRLTLADAVYYASSLEGVDQVIDIATLTGAALIALGEEYTGVLANNERFFVEISAAAFRSGEEIWRLPTNDRLKKMNESKIADLTNSAGRFAGTITAGLFVGEFLAKEDMPWIHMDIAGTSFLSKARGYLPEGATGIHVKSFVEYFTNRNQV